MFAGVVAALRGEAPRPLEHFPPARVTHPHHHSSTYRYCTNFAVTGEHLEAGPWIDALEKIGDSVLVVGDAHTLKVHVHTDDPEEATRLFDGTAAVSRIDVADMQLQMAQRAGRLGNGGGKAATCGVLAVVSGVGMAELFDSLGADLARRRPDAQPLHLRPAGGHPRRPGRGGRGAAQLAERDHGRRARRRALRQDRAGRARALAAGGARRRRRARPPSNAAANADAMEEAVAHVRTGAVTEAARDDTGDRFRRGEAVGFVDEELVAWGEPAATLEAVLGRLATDAELVTLIAGDGVPLDQDAVTALAPAEVEVEYSYGGQPSLLVADLRRVAPTAPEVTIRR